MEKFNELARCVEYIEKDASKFFVNGNKAAGTRARKHLQELKSLAQELRVLIQDVKNEKTRTSTADDGADDQDAAAPQPAYEEGSNNMSF